MEGCVIAAVFMNYDYMYKLQTITYNQLLSEIKILLLGPNKLMPYYQLPMLRMLMKPNKIESIKEGIRRTFGVKSKMVLRMTEARVFIDKTKYQTKSFLMIVFLPSIGYKEHIEKSEFIALCELGKIPIGDQSMDYISSFMRWIKVEGTDPVSLLDWFKPCKRGDVHPVKAKRTTTDSSLERPEHRINTELIYKSASLEGLPRPDSITNVSHSRQQADSLDRISEKAKAATPREIKNAMKYKIAKSKVSSNFGPISAVPLPADTTPTDSNQVMHNPLINSHLEYSWHSDIVVKNPFWDQPSPDMSKIRSQSKSLFDKKDCVFRNRVWSQEYPLHHAAYKGDRMLVTSLVDKGCSCLQRDLAGWTPLHYAVWYGHPDLVLLFLRLELVSVNSATTDSLTPLHLAIINRQSAITNLLLRQPDLDLALTNSQGDNARSLAERYDKQFMIPLIKLITPKMARVQVTLMDGSVRSLVLSHGTDTTFQQLRLQMIDILSIPWSCSDVFSFWIGYRVPKFTGKNSVIPCQCFGPPSTALKELDVSSDWKLLWRRNLMFGLNNERKIKNGSVLSLLFSEALHNFTKKSRYPCDVKDVSLLSSVLLHRFLPPLTTTTGTRNARSTTEDEEAAVDDPGTQRTLSLNRVNRPLSFILGSKLTGQSRQMSASMQTLKGRSIVGRNQTSTSSSVNDLTCKDRNADQRNRQAKAFLSSNKNLALILPKKNLKNSSVNWSEEILKKFQQSRFSYRNNSAQEIEYRFLTLCWNLTLYGCAYFHVEIKLNLSLPFTDSLLAVNDMGIYFLHTGYKNLVQNFKYSTITWHASSSDKCLLLFTKRNNIYVKTKQSMIISDLMLKLYSMNL